MLLDGIAAVSTVNEVVKVVELYIFRGTALVLADDNVIFGATPNPPLNVIVAMVPVALQPVPVVTVIVPELSLPAMDTVGVVQAAVPAAMVGAVPPVMM